MAGLPRICCSVNPARIIDPIMYVMAILWTLYPFTQHNGANMVASKGVIHFSNSIRRNFNSIRSRFGVGI